MNNDKYDVEYKMKKLAIEFKRILINLRNKSYIVKLPKNIRITMEDFNNYYTYLGKILNIFSFYY